MKWNEDHEYSEEQRMLVETIRSFGKGEITPVIHNLEDETAFPEKLVSKMAELGLFGVTIPEEYGGFGLDTFTGALVARELSYFSPALYLICTANSSLAGFPIQYAGSEEQKKHFLPKLVSGEYLGCYALTEPNAGSDAASLKAKAVAYDQELHDRRCLWLVSGQKTFITNAENASVAVVFARTGPDRHNISAFIIEGEPGLKREGVTVKRIGKRMMKSSDFSEIFFDNVSLLKDALLGEFGGGFKIAMATLDRGRINIAAQAVGTAARLVDEAFRYVYEERKQFGKFIWQNQKVQSDFAWMHTKLGTAWEAAKKAARCCDKGLPFTLEASEAKLLCTETAWQVGSKAATYFGGNAVTTELPWLSFLMAIYPTLIYEGANNIQEMVIARELERD